MRSGILAVFIALVLVPVLWAEGAIEENWLDARDVASLSRFDAVSNSSMADVHISIGDDWSMRIDGNSSSVENLQFRMDGDVLRIRQKPGLFGMGGIGSAKIYIGIPYLNSLNVTGSGDAFVDGVIRGDKLSLLSTGTGNIEAQARVEDFSALSTGAGRLKLRIIAEKSELRLTGTGICQIALLTRDANVVSTGTGGFDIEGEAEYMKLSLTGTGAFRGSGFEAKRVSVSITGTGSAELTVIEDLSARLTGVGSIRFRGDAKITNLTQTGIGRVERISR